MKSITKKLDQRLKILRKNLGGHENGVNSLICAMSRTSEERWCAGWLINLEYILWNEMFNDSVKHKPSDLLDLINIALLAKKLGGWIVFDNKKGPTFISFKEWLPRFNRYMSDNNNNIS